MNRPILGLCKTLALAPPTFLLAIMTGCTSPLETDGVGPGTTTSRANQAAPGPLAVVSIAGEDVSFWPYTGRSFDGATVDPMNLVFVGAATPAQIRSALFSLDGDRSSLGLPDAPPFNARWSDAIGDVQTTYAEVGGWSGSVVQVTLGDYAPLRFHLRLFRTGVTIGGNAVTLGSAHFELLIPGTTNHQVLSWMVAREIVVGDLMRSGLLDPLAPAYPSDVIYSAPTYRDIPPFIYNELPPELRALIGGPMGDVTAPVEMPSDGRATIVNLAGAAEPAYGLVTDTFTIDFDQAIPMPFCLEGPFDWVYVTGPVHFDRTTRLGPSGRYSYQSSYRGTLTAVPVDITQSPPVPVGEPFEAMVNGAQLGHSDDHTDLVSAVDRRIAPQDGGTEMLTTRLKVSAEGALSYGELVHCLE